MKPQLSIIALIHSVAYLCTLSMAIAVTGCTNVTTSPASSGTVNDEVAPAAADALPAMGEVVPVGPLVDGRAIAYTPRDSGLAEALQHMTPGAVNKADGEEPRLFKAYYPLRDFWASLDRAANLERQPRDDRRYPGECVGRLLESMIRTAEPWESFGGRAYCDVDHDLLTVVQTADGQVEAMKLLISIRRVIMTRNDIATYVAVDRLALPGKPLPRSARSAYLALAALCHSKTSFGPTVNGIPSGFVEADTFAMSGAPQPLATITENGLTRLKLVRAYYPIYDLLSPAPGNRNPLRDYALSKITDEQDRKKAAEAFDEWLADPYRNDNGTVPSCMSPSTLSALGLVTDPTQQALEALIMESNPASSQCEAWEAACGRSMLRSDNWILTIDQPWETQLKIAALLARLRQQISLPATPTLPPPAPILPAPVNAK